MTGLVVLRGVDRGELLVVAGLDELVVDEETQGLRPLLAIGGRQLDLHFPEERVRGGRGREAGSSWYRLGGGLVKEGEWVALTSAEEQAHRACLYFICRR